MLPESEVHKECGGTVLAVPVAVNAPLPRILTYLADDLPGLARGQRVSVPLGHRKATGVALSSPTPSPVPDGVSLKPITEVDAEYPPLSDTHMQWLEWMSEYYVHPIGQVFDLAFPPLRQTARSRGSRKQSPIPQVELKPKHSLNPEQAHAVSAIRRTPGFSAHLLFGVTGSGKTEVYLELLEKVLEEGKSGLVLVPEISLTPQLLRRFAERFGDRIATLHSQLTDRERTEQWWACFSGEKKILIGARSAIFCPLPNLGLIIVDEEHETSFKQEEKLKYHARDAAVMLARFHQCPIVLGSATPSLESWKNAKDGKFQLHRLTQRVLNQPLPKVTIVDLREVKKLSHLPGWMSPALYEGVRLNLEAGHQSALFLNRRGFSSAVSCVQCGETPLCPDCDISLTLHGKRHLVCHYCNYSQAYHEDCQKCGGASLPLGLGTEQVEEDLLRLFPQARVARADRDEIQSREALENLVERMEKGEIDILVGTQMIAKGFDFPRLRFAGLILADVGFNLPDFRATERSFQLLTQMSGRAGRHGASEENPGQVLIQTYNPDHPSVVYAPQGDYEGFAELELSHREQLHYPPFNRLAVVRIQGPHRDRAWGTACLVQKWLKKLRLADSPSRQFLEVLGPAEAPLARLRRAYRFHILLKSNSPRTLQWIAGQIIERQRHFLQGTKASIDIDPLHLL